MNFKKLETVTKSKVRSKNKKGSYAVIYEGKQHAFHLNMSKEILHAAKLVIGDRINLSLVECSRGRKWIMIEADEDGYQLVAAVANAKGSSAKLKGTFERGIYKTTYVDGFIKNNFSRDAVNWTDDEAEVRIGQIAFPLEKKKAWF